MKRLLLTGVALFLLVSCNDKTESTGIVEKVSPVVAQVGDKKFHEEDIDFEIMSLPESMRYIMQDDVARGQILDVMMKREVVAQKAREMGLHFDPLIAYQMRKAEGEVLIKGIREWEQGDLKSASEDELKAYYKKHTDDFIVPKQIHARHILVADKQTALEILKQIKANPESFPTLAAQFSIDDSTKGRGGDLNWFARGDMMEAFDEVVFKLGQKKPLSKPVKTKFGWHIIQWLGEREEQAPSFEDVQGEIRSILEKEKLDVWLKKLISNADTEILKAAYK